MTNLTNALNRIFTWLKENHPVTAEGFQPGLSSTEIEEKLSLLLFRVPREVYELYRWHNGNKTYEGIFGYLWFTNLDRAYEFSTYINDEYCVEIREQEGDPKYLFPLFDFDGEYFAIEGSNQTEGTDRIFHIGKFHEISFAFINLTSMMLSIAECYETGVYAFSEDNGLEVVDSIEFGRIRHKHNPGTVEALYADGW
jgi:hypothetical protein